MMRAWRWSAGAALLLGLGVAAASFPLRLALEMGGAAQAGVSARAVAGSIWDGELTDAKIGGLMLGDVRAGLSFWGLWRGGPSVEFTGANGLHGHVSTGQRRGLVDGHGRVDLGQRMGPMMLDHLTLHGVTALVDDQGRCVQARGQVQLMLGGGVAGLPLAQGLSGALGCAGGKLRASLASQSGMERMIWEADAMGAWQARVQVMQVREAAMMMALGQMGFQPKGTAYELTIKGRF